LVFRFTPKPSKEEVEEAAEDCLEEGQGLTEVMRITARKEVFFLQSPF
jgi:hypothetical protein